MRFLEEYIARDDGNNEQSRANDVGQKIGKFGKQAMGREQGGEVACGFSEVAANGSCEISMAMVSL